MSRARLASLLALIALPATAADTVVAPGLTPDLTVYNGGFAVVRENRTIRLSDGETRLAFTGVSRNLQPETASVEVTATGKGKAPDVKILDQTFAFNLMSQRSLLEQSIGKEVSVVTTNPASGRDTTERARVLAVQDGVVLDIGGKIHTNVPGRIVFDALPGNLRATPTLLMTATGPTGTDIPIELAYITDGLGWKTDYVANYDSEGGRLDLTAWATVTNTTGVEFKDAKLKLASGDVNREMPRPPMPAAARYKGQDMVSVSARRAVSAGVENEVVDGLNLYAIARPVTLSPGESKQLALLRAQNLTVKRDYVVRGAPSDFMNSMIGQRREGGAEIEVTVKNEGVKPVKGKKAEADTQGLGIPLPAGVVRAYGQDADGTPLFLGEDHIDHVADGADIHLHLGRDVELPVIREQTSFVRAGDKIALSVWRVAMRNAKAKPVTIKVTEPISGDWEIPKETQPHTKNAAGAAEWLINLPAKGEVVLEYTVKTTFDTGRAL